MIEIKGLKEFCKHIGLTPPAEENIDLRIIIPGTHDENNFATFRHRIYAISVYTSVRFNQKALSPVLNSSKPLLFFKVPYQILSSENKPVAATGFTLGFTETFLRDNLHLCTLIFDMPYLRLDRAVPFEIEKEDVRLLRGIFDKMMMEFKSDHNSRMEMIASYLQIYLMQIRRIYFRVYGEDEAIYQVENHNDLAMASQFKMLLDTFLTDADISGAKRSVAYYAKKLAVHPNHLNAAIKRATGSSALELLHNQIISLAKTILSQTNLTIKEIAYQFSFNDPAHLSNFFKRRTGITPIKFRGVSRRNLQ